MLVGHSPFLPYSDATSDEVECAIAAATPLFGRNAPPISKEGSEFIRVRFCCACAKCKSSAALIDCTCPSLSLSALGCGWRRARAPLQRVAPPLPRRG